MDDIFIKKHDFEKAKNQIKTFSDQKPQNLEFQKVEETYFLECINHKVTGKELNNLTEQIQKYLINFSNLHISLIGEFNEVYKALEALDKDYIHAILLTVGGIKKNNDEIKTTQNDVVNTIERQKRIIEVLSQFKEKIENYKNLENINNMWSDVERFKERVEKLVHLNDIDEMWNKCDTIDYDIVFLKNIVNIYQNQIEVLMGNMWEIQEKNEEREDSILKKMKIGNILTGTLSCSITIIIFFCIMRVYNG